MKSKVVLLPCREYDEEKINISDMDDLESYKIDEFIWKI